MLRRLLVSLAILVVVAQTAALAQRSYNRQSQSRGDGYYEQNLNSPYAQPDPPAPVNPYASGRAPSFPVAGAGVRPGSQSISSLEAQVDALERQISASKGSPAAMIANGKQQRLIRELTMMEPQNPKWKILYAKTYVVQAGTPGRSGTAGDRDSFKMALRELDGALACPGGSAYAAEINALKAHCNREIASRDEAGAEIRRRGARQLGRLLSLPDAGGGSPCAHCHAWRASRSTRCGNCGTL